MLPKPNRLPKELFTTVFRRGKRIVSSTLQLFIFQNKLPVSRFAVIVGLKVDKRAVVRNRIKRLVRESVRHLLPSIKTGYDVTIIAKQNFSQQPQQDIEKQIQLLFKNCNVLR